MRFEVHCPKCHDDYMADKQKYPDYDPMETIHPETSDKNLYKYTCKNGHLNAVVRLEPKHEQLFENAMFAIMDKYNREAVASIVASMERLYEYTMKVIFIHTNKSFEIFEEIWKDMKKQSERQLGGFLFSYTNFFGEKPPMISQKQSEFRNNVIHRGYFPTYQEVLSFAESIYQMIFLISQKLNSKCGETIQNINNKRIEILNEEAKLITSNFHVLSASTIFNTVPITMSLKKLDTIMVEHYVNILKRKWQK